MRKILYFLMVGLAFTALQVVTVEAAKDCSDFKPGTPPFDSCVAGNQEAAGGPSAGSLETAGNPAAGMPGTAPMGAPGMPPTAGNPAAGMPGTASMGDTSAAPSIGERVKSFFGMGTKAPSTGTSGTAAPMGTPGTAAPMGTPGTAAPMGTPGTAAPGDPSCAPLANGTLPPHCK